jgi:outer membrane protein, multidrug efflux system
MLLASCMVGPNYKGAPTVLTADAGFKRADGHSEATEPAAQWWTQLNDDELNRLMQAALAASPSVAVAQARLRESRAALRASRANELPNTGVSAAYVRIHNFSTLLGGGQSGSGTGGTGSASGGSGSGSSDLNLYDIGFDATWEIDFFGAKRRAAEQAAAAAQGARASLADVTVSLTAEVGQAYVELRHSQQRLALTERNIDIERQLLQLMQIRQRAGSATELDVARLTNQVDTTRSTLGALHAASAQQMDRLAMLTGREPGALDDQLTQEAAIPAPPEKVAIGDPASLLRRRPDIAGAERRLAQQNAAIGANEAALFPKVTLLGDVGFASLTPAGLFNSGNFTYVAAPVLQWTPWDFGRTQAKISQAKAGRDEAEADYRRTVLAALDDAETALAQFGQQRETVQQLAQALASAERVYTLTEVRLRGGTASTTDVLDADTQRLQAELSYQQALAQLSEDFIGLEKSLGLGWADIRSS